MPIDISNTFTYHKPFGTQPQRYVAIRDKAREFAELIMGACPESAEQTLAIRDIQRAVMMANAAIAIHEVPPPEESR